MKLAWHVQDPGITTNVHVRTPNDGGCTKHYQIKYAYCPPGEENELYVMSWISVNEEQSKLQTFSVSVLPGHHGSGIPQSNVIHESKRCNKYFMAVMNVLSVLSFIFLVLFFATMDCADRKKCPTYCSSCELEFQKTIVPTVIIVTISLIGAKLYAWGVGLPLQNRLDKRIARDALSSWDTLLTPDGLIPMEDVIAILDNNVEEESDDGDEEISEEDRAACVAIACGQAREVELV